MKRNAQTQEKHEKNKKRVKKSGGYIKKFKLSWGWMIITLLFNVGYYGVVSMIPGNTAELYAGKFNSAAIMGLVINYLGMLGLSVISSVVQIMAESKSVLNVRKSIWKQMVGIRSDFYNENAPEELLSAVTSDTEITVSSLIQIMIEIPSLILYLVMCVVQISNYNTKLLAVLFVLVPLYILYAVLMGKWQYKTGRSIQMRIGGLTGFLSERIQNLSLIKSFVTEKKEEEKGVATAGELYKANVQYQYINGVIGAYTFITEATAIVIAVIWACVLLKHGEIKLEAWLAFFMFVPMVNSVLRQLTMIWTSIKEVQGRASRLAKLMDAPQEQLNEAASPEIQNGDIEFSKVGFKYNEEKLILQDIDFTIPSGKITAIVGPSGSGKTTILKLLEQLYQPNSGVIRAEGIDITELNLPAWRSKMSYVTQEASLFGGTIRDCLTYGMKREVSNEELVSATKLVHIYDYIMRQPEGFDSQMAIWGSTMSGGQKQKLVIAREILKDSDILLLDEPTSDLDAQSAAEICEIITEKFKNKTIVIVSHELNFIAGADQIVVLSDGKVEGNGMHEELMKNCNIYRELVEEQSYQEVYVK